jgi:hypothetical protein
MDEKGDGEHSTDDEVGLMGGLADVLFGRVMGVMSSE